MSATSDSALVAAAIAGEIEAFAELSRRHRDRYTRFVARMVGGSRDEAEEVLQAAFIRAHRALDRCADPTRFAAWLHQIVVIECRSFIVRRARRGRRREQRQSQRTPSLHGALADAQIALNQLDVNQREAFLMKCVEGLSFEEMAELTGTTVSVLKANVKRATVKLHEILEGARSA